MFPAFGIDLPLGLASASAKRKADFLAGRYCAQRALLSSGASLFPVGVSESRGPIWPEKLSGSISHCKGRAVAVVCKDASASIGIDIEHVVEERAAIELQHLVLNQPERHWLEQAGLPAAFAFTLIFSAKESLFKAVYPDVKTYFYFEAASVTDFNIADRKIHLSLNRDLGNGWASGDRVIARYREVEPGTVATYVRVERKNLQR